MQVFFQIGDNIITRKMSSRHKILVRPIGALNIVICDKKILNKLKIKKFFIESSFLRIEFFFCKTSLWEIWRKIINKPYLKLW